jgi:hypothetical protein
MDTASRVVSIYLLFIVYDVQDYDGHQRTVGLISVQIK